MTELIAELRRLGATVDKQLPLYNHAVVRLNDRMVVIPTADVVNPLDPAFVARVMVKLEVER